MSPFLAERAGAVISVEIDRVVHEVAREKLAPFTNTTLLLTDILATKNELDPQVVAVVRERLAAIPGSRLKLVANLPYAVATPIVSNLLGDRHDSGGGALVV